MDWFTVSRCKFKKIRKSDVVHSVSLEKLCVRYLTHDFRNVQPIWTIIIICLFLQSIIAEVTLNLIGHPSTRQVSKKAKTDSNWLYFFECQHGKVLTTINTASCDKGYVSMNFSQKISHLLAAGRHTLIILYSTNSATVKRT